MKNLTTRQRNLLIAFSIFAVIFLVLATAFLMAHIRNQAQADAVRLRADNGDNRLTAEDRRPLETDGSSQADSATDDQNSAAGTQLAGEVSQEEAAMDRFINEIDAALADMDANADFNESNLPTSD